MVAFAPRLDARLVEALERLDDGRIGYAELNRRIGLVAVSLDLPRPSYQAVRCLVRDIRDDAARKAHEPGLARIVVEVAYQLRPFDDLRRELDRRELQRRYA